MRLSLPARISGSALRRRLRPLMLMIVIVLTLLELGGAARADDVTIGTIIIQGLHGIEREQLLADLGVDEGDVFYTGLLGDLEQRSRRLPYLKRLNVRCQVMDSAAHLHFTLRMEKRIVIGPVIAIGEDGDLSGGFDVRSRSLIGGRETWDARAIAGGFTLARLRMNDFRLWSAALPAFNLNVGIEDWSQPFWDPTGDVDEKRIWALGGPSFRLPRGGRLLLLGGVETQETDPVFGYAEDGRDEHGLFTATLRQPLVPRRLNLTVRGELRTPERLRGHARGDVTLAAFHQLGRWRLEGRLKGGLVNAWAPTTNLYYMDSWDILHAYDPGGMPAREFVSFRARGDLPFFHIPIRTRRNGPEEDMIFSAFLLAEGASFRLDRSDDFASATDWGLGISAEIPVQPPIRVSGGTVWGEEGASRQILLVETR